MGRDHTKSKIGAISGPTKWILVQEKLKKQQQQQNWPITYDTCPQIICIFVWHPARETWSLNYNFMSRN